MATTIKKIDDSIIKLFAEHKTMIHDKFHVESLVIFGSVSRGSAGPNSDIDILVSYRETPGFFAFLDLKQYLEGIVGRPVDLVTEGALKKQLREQIIQEAINVA
jgi:predicted nucleotidyltransferase